MEPFKYYARTDWIYNPKHLNKIHRWLFTLYLTIYSGRISNLNGANAPTLLIDIIE